MRPIDFVVHDGGSDPTSPVSELAMALNEDIQIFIEDNEYEVLSYYMVEGKMSLDIQKKD